MVPLSPFRAIRKPSHEDVLRLLWGLPSAAHIERLDRGEPLKNVIAH